ncbi:MAG: hypothetical protein ACE5JS_20460 [Nitrospinota bacterium]
MLTLVETGRGEEGRAARSSQGPVLVAEANAAHEVVLSGEFLGKVMLTA